MPKKLNSVFLQLALSTGLILFEALTPASANVLAFEYLGTGDTGSVTADGSFTIGAPDMGGFDITAISGTYNGSTITGLLDPTICCSLLLPPPDNILYYPNAPYLDLGGVVFADALGDTVNIFFDDISNDYVAFNLLDDSLFNGSLTVTPIPSSLSLMGTIMAAAFLVAGWLKRRKDESSVESLI